jgi:hypothetical protein
MSQHDDLLGSHQKPEPRALSGGSFSPRSEQELESSQEPSVSTTDDFKESLVPLQVRVPADLRDSLKLLSHSTGQSMSELVLKCLTTQEVISKAWVSTKRNSRRAA